ncbi:hypothetical protein MPTK1_8g08120 [Marchantia polymorpha subsp. ruderalis]|uniref:Uncharacterized protein n=1 Tax=Marchantia polymorpha TaxID=3197 RepID=A0A2R6W4M8_MARPO|nr:hypothetical protein MARPO_0155s0006 [Marchantia polymorpha]BBN19129.1 hypothetical protein Mp_8g08120 [Marchantia polymorpha subsp. ruderalis]|eukprot:PTQ28742.1 hypothetical protein MARPO_0155s0006 [Marchantia polymorpha]
MSTSVYPCAIQRSVRQTSRFCAAEENLCEISAEGLRLVSGANARLFRKMGFCGISWRSCHTIINFTETINGMCTWQKRF